MSNRFGRISPELTIAIRLRQKRFGRYTFQTKTPVVSWKDHPGEILRHLVDSNPSDDLASPWIRSRTSTERKSGTLLFKASSLASLTGLL